MMRQLLLICALAALFSGCGIRSEKPKTIASLHGRPVPAADDINLEDSRARAKAAYRRILETHPDEIMHAESLRRLGDLTLEDEMPQTATSDEDELLLDEKRAKETIKLYSKLLETYPDYRLNDRVLYQLARAYDQSGQHEKISGGHGSAGQKTSEIKFDIGSPVSTGRVFVCSAPVCRC